MNLVFAFVAVQYITALAAIEHVVAGATAHYVYGLRVVVGNRQIRGDFAARINAGGQRAGENHVRTIAALDRVTGQAAKEPVVAVVAVEPVAVLPAVYRIGVVATVDRIAAPAAVNRVGARAAMYGVGAG